MYRARVGMRNGTCGSMTMGMLSLFLNGCGQAFPPFGPGTGKRARLLSVSLMPASARMSRLGVGLLDSVDEFIGDVELYLDRTVKVDDADTFYRLRSIPGVGKILVRRRSPVDLILAFNAVFLALFLNRFSIV